MNISVIIIQKLLKEKNNLMTDFDRIRNIIIDYEDEKMTMEQALDEICGVCLARNIRIWDAKWRNMEK